MSYVLHQYYHAHITQSLLLEQLHEWEMEISAGQLNHLLTEGHERFHEEKAKVKAAGLAVSPITKPTIPMRSIKAATVTVPISMASRFRSTAKYRVSDLNVIPPLADLIRRAAVSQQGLARN